MIAEILTSVNKTLRKEFPGMKIYGKEIKEGFDRPSFFVEVEDRGTELFTANVSFTKCTVGIFYFQTQKGTKGYSESINLVVAEKLRELFSLTVKTTSRVLTVNESMMSYEDDILQMTFSLEFYVRNERKHSDVGFIENVELDQIKVKETE